MKKSFRRHFTLIELLGVIAVIAILAAIGFGSYSSAQNKSRIAATQSVVQSMEQAMEACRVKFGYFPVSAGKDWATFSVRKDKDGNVTDLDFGDSRVEKFFRGHFSMDLLTANGSNEIVDVWGNPIYWCNPGKFDKTRCEIISAGPDGKFGSSGSSTPTDVLTDYKDSGTWKCDDIANF